MCLQIAGLLITTFAGSGDSWSRYGGLLIIGFGLGPTVPITMTWTNEIFQKRHGEVGVAAASALVSGLGNLGSIVTTYALYEGWPEDADSKHPFRNSNLVMIAILVVSIISSVVNTVLLRAFNGGSPKKASGSSSVSDGEGVVMDRAARRELQERGLGRLWIRK